MTDYDGAADSLRSWECCIAMLRLRHEAEEGRRIAAMADHLAAIAQRVAEFEHFPD